MKNQYVADIGDFGKYSLLRAFAEAGVKIGVNWYLTEDDGSTDGKFIDYLNDERIRYRDPEVFDVLKKISSNPNRSVYDVQDSNIIRNAIFFDILLKPQGTPLKRKTQRKSWFFDSMNALSEAELIFMDPDNGLLSSNDYSKLDAEKYVLPDEVEQYYAQGHNVVYYCHKGRRRVEAWEEYKLIMRERIPEAKMAVLTYHKGTQRSYVFLIHEESFVRYRAIIDKFIRRWYRDFTEESVNNINDASVLLGEPLIVRISDGTEVSIQNRADGRLQIKSSNKPGEIRIITADWLCNSIGI